MIDTDTHAPALPDSTAAALNLSSWDAHAAADAGSGWVPLGHLGMLEFAGAKRDDFLQGYFTRDTTRLQPARALFGATCNIKGRMTCSGWLVSDASVTRYRISADLLPQVQATLAKYAPFSRTTLSAGQWLGIGLLGAAASRYPDGPPGTCIPIGSGVLLRCHGSAPRFELWAPAAELVSVVAALDSPVLSRQAWLLAEIEAGVVTIDTRSSERHVPQVCGLNALAGIDFDKGCYLGQEIIARLQYRGAAKRALQRLRLPGARSLPASTDLQAHGRSVGELVASALTVDGVHALAVMGPDADAPADADGQSWELLTAT